MSSRFSLLVFAFATFGASYANAQATVLTGPSGSARFGESITVLQNGNYVVADTGWDNGSVPDVGAIYLFNGATHARISTLTGSTANDRVGNGGVIALPDGNFVVVSPSWARGNAAAAGAVTWASGTAGVTGAVGLGNSLVGSTANDRVGGGGLTVLTNGNYVVKSPAWDNASAQNAGAATWGSGSAGIVGSVSSANSLVATRSNDSVSSGGVTALTNGHYVVCSPKWAFTSFSPRTGAVTWGNGSTGTSGVVASSNSLTGQNLNDEAGSGGVTPLPNGNYVVLSPLWDFSSTPDCGAATVCFGGGLMTASIAGSNSRVGTQTGDFSGSYVVPVSTTGYLVVCPNWDNGSVQNVGTVGWRSATGGNVFNGAFTSGNSLIGSQTDDQIGSGGAMQLLNGDYLILSPNWNRGTIADAGAATVGYTATGSSGPISIFNSLVGSQAGDRVGSGGAVALPGGNFAVASPYWDNGANPDAGAVTWGSANAGATAALSGSNSLVGTSAGDSVGSGGITTLTNGNYVVASPNWNNGSNQNVGAVTWASGATGVAGAVSATNSLIGGSADDGIGAAVAAFPNGNYTVSSPHWRNGTIARAGAVTFANGASATIGVVNSTNSLVGTSVDDSIGSGGVTVLPNGGYLVSSPEWDNGTIQDAGAATRGSTSTGIAGPVSATNSLVGVTANESISAGGVEALASGAYVVRSPVRDNGPIADAGALSYSSGSTPLVGVVTPCNSVLGGIASSGASMSGAPNDVQGYYIAGLAAENRIIVFTPGAQTLASASAVATETIAAGSGPVPLVAGGCQLVASIASVGAAPITGSTVVRVWIQSVQPSGFVRRHYEVTPAASAPSATARITLYFTQAEFDSFNDSNVVKLPTGPTDVAGKAALMVERRLGASANGSGLPSTYSGLPSTLDLLDADIVWNAAEVRWEVSFETVAGAGFFVKTQSASSLLPPVTEPDENGVIVLPVPATDAVTITITDPRLIGRQAHIYSVEGRAIKHILLSENTVLNVAGWPPGIYVLRLPDGTARRVVKQ